MSTRRKAGPTRSLDEGVADCHGRGYPVVDLQLGEDAAQVRFDGGEAEVESAADLSVGEALGEEYGHVTFALGEGVQRRFRLRVDAGGGCGQRADPLSRLRTAGSVGEACCRQGAAKVQGWP